MIYGLFKFRQTDTGKILCYHTKYTYNTVHTIDHASCHKIFGLLLLKDRNADTLERYFVL